MGVAFDELFGAAAREADGEAAVFVLAFNADDSADAVLRMAHLLADQWVGIAATPGSGPAEARFRTWTLGRRLTHSRRRTAPDAAEKFIGRIRVLGVGFVPAG